MYATLREVSHRPRSGRAHRETRQDRGALCAIRRRDDEVGSGRAPRQRRLTFSGWTGGGFKRASETNQTRLGLRRGGSGVAPGWLPFAFTSTPPFLRRRPSARLPVTDTTRGRRALRRRGQGRTNHSKNENTHERRAQYKRSSKRISRPELRVLRRGQGLQPVRQRLGHIVRSASLDPSGGVRGSGPRRASRTRHGRGPTHNFPQRRNAAGWEISQPSPRVFQHLFLARAVHAARARRGR